MSNVTMRQMLEAGVHFGHQTRYWSPKMRPFIFGERNKIHIINLEKTLPMFNDAMNYIGQVVGKGGSVLIVGTKRPATKLVKDAAERAGTPYVNHRWLGGMLTNWPTIRQSIRHLDHLDRIATDGTYDKLKKKEVLLLEKERARLVRTLTGIRNMGGIPGLVVIIDIRKEHIAVREAAKLKIPSVAIVDTNCDPDQVDYPIPGNDDAIRSIGLIAQYLADAVIEGKAEAAAAKGKDKDEAAEATAEVKEEGEAAQS